MAPRPRREDPEDDGRTIVNMNVEGMPWYDRAAAERYDLHRHPDRFADAFRRLRDYFGRDQLLPVREDDAAFLAICLTDISPGPDCNLCTFRLTSSFRLGG